MRHVPIIISCNHWLAVKWHKAAAPLSDTNCHPGDVALGVRSPEGGDALQHLAQHIFSLTNTHNVTVSAAAV